MSKHETRVARNALIFGTALTVIAAGIVLASLPFASPNNVARGGLHVSWNPAVVGRFHAPVSTMGIIGVTNAVPTDRGMQANFQPLVGGAPGSIAVNAYRFITDKSYIPQSETTLALGEHAGNSYLLTGVNDGRWFFCGALPASDCPSGYTVSISGFSLGTVSGSTPTLLMSDNIPGLLYRSTVNPNFVGFLVSWGDPSVGFGPNGNFYYASLAIDPVTGNNGIELAESNSHLFTNPSSCTTPGGAPWTNPCWSATLVFGNLSGFQNGHGTSHAPTSFEDKELIAIDSDSSSAYYGDVYVSWDHFYASGTSSTYMARCTPALVCTMVSGGGARVLSTGSPFVAFSTPAVSPNGGVHVSWCNYGTTTTLGPITCYVANSGPGGQSFGSPVAVVSFEGAGTNFPSYTGIVGYATEQFRTDSIPVIAVDGGSSSTSGNLYLTVGACVQGSYYAFSAPAEPGNCNSSAVLFSSSTNGGLSWSAPVAVSPPGVVNAQPWVTVDPSNGHVIVSYYTSAYDAFSHRLDVQAAVSSNSGASWTHVRLTNVSDEPNADPVLFDYTTQFGGAFVVPQFGDYIQSVASGGTIWTAFSGNYAMEDGTFQTDPFVVAGVD